MASRLKPLRSRGLVDEAAERLRAQIVTGRLRSGERLVETKLAADLQISRGPLREALSVLRGEGLIAEIPRRGSFVVALSGHDIAEIYEFRAALESHAARLLVERADNKARAELERQTAAIRIATANGDQREVWRADLNFHEMLCKLTGNKRIYAAYRQQAQVLRALFMSEGYPHDTLDQAAADHTHLVERIAAGDADEAAAAFRAHALSARDRVVAYCDRMEAESEETAKPGAMTPVA